MRFLCFFYFKTLVMFLYFILRVFYFIMAVGMCYHSSVIPEPCLTCWCRPTLLRFKRVVCVAKSLFNDRDSTTSRHVSEKVGDEGQDGTEL